MPAFFHLLSDAQINDVLQAAFRLLEHIGVKITQAEARALLRRAGARLEGERVYLTERLVLQALETTPQTVVIYDRSGHPVMHLEERNVYYGAHTDAPDILDPFNSIRRPCLEQDVQNHVLLADALPNISFLTASGLVADRKAGVADRVSLSHCLINSSKPVLVMPISLGSLAQMRTMAALAVGGEKSLDVRPNVIVYVEPISPLAHPDESMGKLLYCARHRLPVAYVPFAARGATAPIGQAAIIAQLTAESLSALVVHQLEQPGAPFIFGGMASVMDMRTTVFSYGAPEFQLGNCLMAEVAHYLHLSNFGTGGTSDSQIFDGQAFLEATTSCLMAHLCGAHLVHDIGLLGSATVIMPEMIVASDYIAAMLRHLLADVNVNTANLALNLFIHGASTGEFLTDESTLADFRQVWYSDLNYRGGAEAWAEGSQTTFEERVKARTCQLIREHQPDELPAEMAADVLEIVQRAEGEV
jgi:trimethylamine--corrinoid protein Co-methyltransferase